MISLKDIQGLRSDLGKNKLKKVFTDLEALNGTSREKEVKLLKRRYSATIRDETQELITKGEARVEINKISSALLSMLDELEAELEQKDAPIADIRKAGGRTDYWAVVRKYRWPLVFSSIFLIGFLIYSNLHSCYIKGLILNAPPGIPLDSYTIECQGWKTKVNASGEYYLSVPCYLSPQAGGSYEILIYTEGASNKIPKTVKQLNSDFNISL